jgi:hypothetical protein
MWPLIDRKTTKSMVIGDIHYGVNFNDVIGK